jgi:hypothetical protein
MRSTHLLRVAILLAIGAGCSESTGPSTGTITLKIRTTGGDPDDAYDIQVNDRTISVPANANVEIYREPDTYRFLVSNVADNCIVSGENPRDITLGSREKVGLEFDIDCAATGVAVNTRTSGFFTPPSYILVIDGHGVGAVLVNGSTTITRISQGTHSISLNLPGQNCVNDSGNDRTVEVTNRTIVPVSFEVICSIPVRTERIAFVRETTGSNPFGQIALVDPDGSNLVILGPGASPSWSPDGTRLVYSTYNCDFYYGCSGSLMIADPEVAQASALASALRPITPSWSPQGDVIAFVDLTTAALYLVDPSAPTDFHRITLDGAAGMRNPAWSPDGSRIAAGCGIGTSLYHICTFDRDGKNLSRLTDGLGVEVEPAWSPDGNTIAYTWSFVIGGETSIYIMQSDGTSQRKLATGSSPTWSRDGSQIVFAGVDGLYSIRPDGSGLSRLTTGKDHAPAWRP